MKLTRALVALFLIGATQTAQARSDFSICWSVYAGWLPWAYGAHAGIVDRWADKYGINIDVVEIDSYLDSIERFSAGEFDGCTMTNMDALTLPAAAGLDTTALVVGDFSSGNDGVVLRSGLGLNDLEGRQVHLVEGSVSHYLLARAIERGGIERDAVQVVSSSERALVDGMLNRTVDAAVTWNPWLERILEPRANRLVFSSSETPGEIIDLLAVNTRTLEAYPALGKALTGAWYEIMRAMRSEATARPAKQFMADTAGISLQEFESQLASTEMFYRAGRALALLSDPELLITMTRVARFSVEEGFLDRDSQGAHVGIATPSGVIGDPTRIKLRFNSEFTRAAARGEL